MSKIHKQVLVYQKKISNGQYTDEKCSILLVIREMQLKTTIRTHYTPMRMAEIKKTSKNVEHQHLSETPGGKVKFYNYSEKQWALSSKMLKLYIPFDPVFRC